MPDVPVLPEPLPALDALPTTSSRVATVLEEVRSAATTTSDAWSDTSTRGLTGDWSGLAADTAGHAFAVFGRDSDRVAVALEHGTLALDVYADQLTDLDRDRTRLVEDRADWSTRLTALHRRVDAAGPDAGESEADALRTAAARLGEDRDRLTDRAEELRSRTEAAEDRLVRALQRVDTDAEAAQEADRTERPDAARLRHDLAALGADAAAVASWWETLTPAQREALRVDSPALVGSANGVPVADRDRANRALLERDADRLRALRDAGHELTPDEQHLLAKLTATQQALDAGTTTLDPSTGRPVTTFLVLHDPDAFGGDGAAAVAYGDPDTADHTAVMVPGLTNDQTKMAGLGQDALHVLRATGSSPGGTAVVAWMGYDAPSGAPESLDDLVDLASVTREDEAEAGGHLLSDFVDGLRATHDAPAGPGDLTVVGHSYGSTTVAHGAADDGLAADALVLVGSPGAGGAERVGDLGMPPGTVYVGAAEHDPVTWLGGDTVLGLGRDPAQADFGATRFAVDDGTPFHVDEVAGQGLANHSSYYDPLTNPTSLDNLGAIVRGDEPDVVPGRDEPARDRLADFATSEGARWVEQGIDELEQLGQGVRLDERLSGLER